ncbi:MAG TPA: hypothetical protein VHA82_01190 [Ramlibacter sp.]|uniref:hypothetical protein n=1 Tax=Ramlibacter sp. TaxID=1917967 RepID=UPI002B657917|nr:hypothetical protein [Ramlibacter sp.]HVZ42396.1 hypothetical protein [Ramlibacter sp.]
MSFLNQLKSQAHSLQSQRTASEADLELNTAATEKACRVVFDYFQDLARQLNVIQPAGPAFTLDGKTPWPQMKLTEFRADARKKMLRDHEVFDFIALGWQVLPQVGKPVGGVVSVNFPPDLQRVQDRIALGVVEHERKEIRHPETNKLQAYVFEYVTHSRASVTATPEHDKGEIEFRLVNTAGFELVKTSWPAVRLNQEVLDELAKRIVSQPSRFV